MSVAAQVVQSVDAAFQAFGDVLPEIVYREVSRVYDPNTGRVTETITDTELRAAVLGYRNEEVDDDTVLRTDRLCLIPKSAMDPVPNTEDQVLLGITAWSLDASGNRVATGEVYAIVGTDEQVGYWILQLRRQ